jgi:Glycosyl hydrolase catalytic core
MSLRRILPIGLLAAVALGAPAAAQANFTVAIGDQNAGMFAQPRFQALKIKKVRYLVPWDWYKDAGQAAEVNAYMNAAHAAKQDVLVSFTARRGCYVNGKYSKSKACRAPSASAYKSAFLRFDKQFNWVKTYSAWNEVNHVSQPTAKSPALAARYYNVLRLYTKSHKFSLVAADVLDSSNVASYLRSFLRAAKGSPRLWGLHNYEDVNRKRSTGTRAVLRTVPGTVWMTETGGILQFAPNFPRSESRAANRASYMFSLASTYSTKRSGYRSKITRLYYYQYTGADPSARFDAGLVNPDGTPRKAYETFLSKAKHRSR